MGQPLALRPQIAFGTQVLIRGGSELVLHVDTWGSQDYSHVRDVGDTQMCSASVTPLHRVQASVSSVSLLNCPVEISRHPGVC